MSPMKLGDATLGLLEGQWPGLHGPDIHYVGPYGCWSSHIGTKRPPQPIPGAAEGFRKCSSATKWPKQRQLWAFVD